MSNFGLSSLEKVALYSTYVLDINLRKKLSLNILSFTEETFYLILKISYSGQGIITVD